MKTYPMIPSQRATLMAIAIAPHMVVMSESQPPDRLGAPRFYAWFYDVEPLRECGCVSLRNSAAGVYAVITAAGRTAVAAFVAMEAGVDHGE